MAADDGREPAGFAFLDPPLGTNRALSVSPRLESWDAKGSQSQRKLTAFLDHVVDLASGARRGMDDQAGVPS